MSQSDIYQNGAYLEANPSWHEEETPWKGELISRLLERNKLVPSSVCEIGCGSGGILVYLAEKYGEDVTFAGYDISHQAIQISQKNARKNISFHLQDMLEEKNLSFDVVMAIDVFEHVEDYLGFLRKMKGTGTFKVFHIPLDLSVQSVFRPSSILKARSAVGHLHYFTKETALATLTDLGYEVLDYFYTGTSLDLASCGWKSDLLRIPRRICFALHQDLAVRILGGYSLMVLTK